MPTLKPYPSYKDTDLPWLAQIPAHWEAKPLFAEMREMQRKNTGNKETNVLSLSYGNIIRRDVESNFGLLPESFETYQIVYPGNIVLRLTDLQNDKRSLRTGQVKEVGIITSAYTCLEVGKQMDKDFAHYLLHGYDLLKVFYQLGAGVRQTMKFDDLKRLLILVPPLPEQQAIAAYLDRQTAKIDALIAKKQRLLDLLAEKRAALISQAVTKGLNPDVKMKDSGVAWLGQVPSHWEKKKIKHVVHQIIDTEHKTAPFYPGGEYLVVRTSNIKNGKLVFDDAKYTDFNGYAEWTRRGKPNPGDILFTREAPAGEACIVPENLKLCVGQRTVLFRVNHSVIDSEYCLWSLYGGLAAKFIQDLSQGSTVAHFNMQDIGNIPLLLPPLDEQKAISSHLKIETNRVDDMVAKVETVIERLREYRAALISSVVTGKVDVSKT